MTAAQSTGQQSEQESHDVMSTPIRELNNRGCVNLTMGNFAEALHFFELALFQHRNVAKAIVAANGMRTIDSDGDNETGSHVVKSQMCDCIMGYETEYDDEDDDEDISIDIDDQNEGQTETDKCSIDEGRNVSAQKLDGSRIRRMTNHSRLESNCYFGQNGCYLNEWAVRDQDRNQCGRCRHYHEIYCLPIVMDEIEWDVATIEDRTFLLIFNTAICNHLWGMQIQQQTLYPLSQKQKQDQQRNHLTKQTFTVASSLYQLAMEIANKEGQNSTLVSRSATASIDYRLCIVAMLNNFSHVSKTLFGASSERGYLLDQMLVKAIFWWRDSQWQRRQQTGVDHDFLDENNTDYVYEDDEVEIIEKILGNVFYLIGLPPRLAPAAAA